MLAEVKANDEQIGVTTLTRNFKSMRTLDKVTQYSKGKLEILSKVMMRILS
jgi:hypothetical protein